MVRGRNYNVKITTAMRHSVPRLGMAGLAKGPRTDRRHGRARPNTLLIYKINFQKREPLHRPAESPVKRARGFRDR